MYFLKSEVFLRTSFNADPLRSTILFLFVFLVYHIRRFAWLGFYHSFHANCPCYTVIQILLSNHLIMHTCISLTAAWIDFSAEGRFLSLVAILIGRICSYFVLSFWNDNIFFFLQPRLWLRTFTCQNSGEFVMQIFSAEGPLLFGIFLIIASVLISLQFIRVLCASDARKISCTCAKFTPFWLAWNGPIAGPGHVTYPPLNLRPLHFVSTRNEKSRKKYV